MSFRFNRRLSIFKGVRLNLSKSGSSVSIGGRGAWLTFGNKGARATVGIPGTGMSWSEKISPRALSANPQTAHPPGSTTASKFTPALRLALLLGFWGLVVFFLVKYS